MKKKYYVASISYGKDSLAMLLKIKELNLPLDEVIFVEVMFDDETSGLHPKQLEFIEKARYKLEHDFDVKINHLKALRTYSEQFYTIKQKGSHKGEIYGFPYVVGAWCNSRLKVDVINKYLTRLKRDYEVVQYVGIAYDESSRIKIDPNINYPLVDLKITEEEAKDICIEHDLYSPLYNSSINRDGCWFCNKQPLDSLKDIYNNYPNLWMKLKKMESASPVKFKPNMSLSEIENKFAIKYKQMTIYDY